MEEEHRKQVCERSESAGGEVMKYKDEEERHGLPAHCEFMLRENTEFLLLKMQEINYLRYLIVFRNL